MISHRLALSTELYLLVQCLSCEAETHSLPFPEAFGLCSLSYHCSRLFSLHHWLFHHYSRLKGKPVMEYWWVRMDKKQGKGELHLKTALPLRPSRPDKEKKKKKTHFYQQPTWDWYTERYSLRIHYHTGGPAFYPQWGRGSEE